MVETVKKKPTHGFSPRIDNKPIGGGFWPEFKDPTDV